MSTHFRPYALAVVSALGILGCVDDGTGTSSSSSSSSSGTTTSSGADGGVTASGKACLDTAAAYATAAQRCGGDYEANRKAFISNLANGDCNSVSIRNEAELRSQCIPSFSSITCTDLQQQRFVPGCAEQLVRDK